MSRALPRGHGLRRGQTLHRFCWVSAAGEAALLRRGWRRSGGFPCVAGAPPFSAEATPPAGADHFSENIAFPQTRRTFAQLSLWIFEKWRYSLRRGGSCGAALQPAPQPATASQRAPRPLHAGPGMPRRSPRPVKNARQNDRLLPASWENAPGEKPESFSCALLPQPAAGTALVAPKRRHSEGFCNCVATLVSKGENPVPLTRSMMQARSA